MESFNRVRLSKFTSRSSAYSQNRSPLKSIRSHQLTEAHSPHYTFWPMATRPQLNHAVSTPTQEFISVTKQNSGEAISSTENRIQSISLRRLSASSDRFRHLHVRASSESLQMELLRQLAETSDFTDDETDGYETEEELGLVSSSPLTETKKDTSTDKSFYPAMSRTLTPSGTPKPTRNAMSSAMVKSCDSSPKVSATQNQKTRILKYLQTDDWTIVETSPSFNAVVDGSRNLGEDWCVN